MFVELPLCSTLYIMGNSWVILNIYGEFRNKPLCKCHSTGQGWYTWIIRILPWLSGITWRNQGHRNSEIEESDINMLWREIWAGLPQAWRFALVGERLSRPEQNDRWMADLPFLASDMCIWINVDWKALVQMKHGRPPFQSCGQGAGSAWPHDQRDLVSVLPKLGTFHRSDGSSCQE